MKRAKVNKELQSRKISERSSEQPLTYIRSLPTALSIRVLETHKSSALANFQSDFRDFGTSAEALTSRELWSSPSPHVDPISDSSGYMM